MATNPAVTPYWERLPRFLAYPLYPPGIWVVLGAAGIGTLVHQLFTPFYTGLQGFLYALLMLAVLLAVVRYGYEVLARTAENNLTPPPSDVLSGGYHLPFKQFAILVCGLFAINITGSVLGPELGFVVEIAVYLLVPASIIILAWTESFLAALNPTMLVQLALALKWHYAALFGLLFLIGQSQGYLSALIPAVLPRFAIIFALWAIQFHFTLVLFHLMGYFLLQFGYRLGIEPPSADDEEGTSEDYSLFDKFMNEGQYGAALGELTNIAERCPNDLDVQRRVHRTAILAGDTKVMAKAADRLIAGYVAQGRDRDAADVALETLPHMPDYRPQEGGSYLGLARGLRTRGHPKEVVKLCNGFHKRFPKHPDIPDVYGIVAWTFRSELNQENQYHAICRFLLQHYPDHPTTISTTAFHRE